MDRLLRLGGAIPGLSQASGQADGPAVDTAEQVYISSLALLKMLKHGRAGVPMEVMGLMLGVYFPALFISYSCRTYFIVYIFETLTDFQVIILKNITLNFYARILYRIKMISIWKSLYRICWNYKID